MTTLRLSVFRFNVLPNKATQINRSHFTIKSVLTPLGFKRLRGDFKRHNSHRVYAALRTSEHLLRSS